MSEKGRPCRNNECRMRVEAEGATEKVKITYRHIPDDGTEHEEVVEVATEKPNCPICGIPKDSPNYAYHVCVPPRPQKLSEKWKPRFNQFGFTAMLPTQMVVFWSEFEALEQERDTLNVQNTMLILKWKTSEAFAEGTAKKLKEQLGIVENACQDWRDKAESAEAEVIALKKQLADVYTKWGEATQDRVQFENTLTDKLEDAEKRSREWHDEFVKVCQKHIEDKARLAKAQERIDFFKTAWGDNSTIVEILENVEKALGDK